VKRLKVALDCDVSPRLKTVLSELYADRGFEFVHVTDFVLARTDDEIWADAFKRFGGSVVLSANKRIGMKPHQAIAFIENGFASFFMMGKWSKMAGHMKAAHLAYWWPAIEETVRAGAAGRCYKVPCEERAGALTLCKCELEEMKIPEAVLAEAKKEKSGRRA
jgi:hypothetical protein